MPAVLALMAHPDDIEFIAAGTLLQLQVRGWDVHYCNVASGDLGSTVHNRDETRVMRLKEARESCEEVLGATFYPPMCDDLGIFYQADLLQKVAAVVRLAQPRIVLTHALSDYMEDHVNTGRLAVTAAFARGMPNYETNPALPPVAGDVTVYHGMPHGLATPLRQRVQATLYVDTGPVQTAKRSALARHASQKEWLDHSQGLDSYLATMEELSREVGRLSRRFIHAEGWNRHLHLGFSACDDDPLAEALGDAVAIDLTYEQSLQRLI